MYEVRLIQNDEDTCLYRHTKACDALKSAHTTVTFYNRMRPGSFIEPIYGEGFFNRIGYKLRDGLYSGVLGEKPVYLEVKIIKK